MNAPTSYFARRAWLAGGPAEPGWASDVLLRVDRHGRWSAIESGAQPPRDGLVAELHSPVLPGIVNAHSHAFQRAIAGLAERSGGGHDDFWSWRDRMYRAALRITPDQLEAIAAQLYTELLRGGYTHVCEFHYLHNDEAGRPYADTAELAMALVRAALATGIGLTLLPTLYMRSGFDAVGLRDDQRRFASTPDSVLRIAERVNGLRLPRVQAGVAIHSLRAVDPVALLELVNNRPVSGTSGAGEDSQSTVGTIHIHIAEQTREVDDCVALHGQRPIDWLIDHVPLDAGWNLVHATHASASELQRLRRTDAAVVICPSTEANLGDGVFDLAGWLAERGNWSIGSDSHISRRATEELRLLEYSQRLSRRERNVAARAAGINSSAAALLTGALSGGSAAAGLPLAGIAIGQRADFCVIDEGSAALLGIDDDDLLDALVFSTPDARLRATYVGGRLADTKDLAREQAFVGSLRALWSDSERADSGQAASG